VEDHRTLNQQDIHQENSRVDDQTIQEDPFDQAAADDLPDEIDIEGQFENRDEIDKEKIVDRVNILNGGDRFNDQDEQEKKGKDLQIPRTVPAPENSKACQEGNSRKNG
jgi:hypothetical protein